MTRTAEDNQLKQLVASFEDCNMRAALGRIADSAVRLRMIELLRLLENPGCNDPVAAQALEIISRLVLTETKAKDR